MRLFSNRNSHDLLNLLYDCFYIFSGITVLLYHHYTYLKNIYLRGRLRLLIYLDLGLTYGISWSWFLGGFKVSRCSIQEQLVCLILNMSQGADPKFGKRIGGAGLISCTNTIAGKKTIVLIRIAFWMMPAWDLTPLSRLTGHRSNGGNGKGIC